MSILDKIKKNSSIKDSAILAKSKFFNNKDMIRKYNRIDDEFYKNTNYWRIDS